MSSFKDIPFKLVPRQSRWPMPARDRDGVKWFEAEVQLNSQADMDDFRNLEAVVDVQPALGTYNGLVTVMRQKDPMVSVEGILIIPDAKGVTKMNAAIITRFQAQVSGTDAERYRANVTWLITDDEVVP